MRFNCGPHQQLRSILGRECLCSLSAPGLFDLLSFGCRAVRLRPRRRPARITSFARRRAHAEQACRLVRLVLEGVRRAGGFTLMRLPPEDQAISKVPSRGPIECVAPFERAFPCLIPQNLRALYCSRQQGDSATPAARTDRLGFQIAMRRA